LSGRFLVAIPSLPLPVVGRPDPSPSLHASPASRPIFLVLRTPSSFALAACRFNACPPRPFHRRASPASTFTFRRNRSRAAEGLRRPRPLSPPRICSPRARACARPLEGRTRDGCWTLRERPLTAPCLSVNHLPPPLRCSSRTSSSPLALSPQLARRCPPRLPPSLRATVSSSTDRRAARQMLIRQGARPQRHLLLRAVDRRTSHLGSIGVRQRQERAIAGRRRPALLASRPPHCLRPLIADHPPDRP
jgi:hypothetical protein